MDFNSENSETWDWQGTCNFLDDNFDVSNFMWSGPNQEDDISFVFDDQITPIKDCGDFSYFVNNCEEIKGLDKCKEPSSQVKRCRMLRFDSEGFDTFTLGDTSFAGVRSKYRESPVEENLSELSNSVSGHAEGTLSASGYENLDQSSETWLASLFCDADTHISPKDQISSVQIDADEISNPAASSLSNQGHPARTRRHNLRGRKSHVKTPANLASFVAYPFAFLKPCAVDGDVTLKDINQRIRIHSPVPSNSNRSDEDSASYPTSALSGKSVVGTTMIHTEGGKRKIKILRTRV